MRARTRGVYWHWLSCTHFIIMGIMFIILSMSMPPMPPIMLEDGDGPPGKGGGRQAHIMIRAPTRGVCPKFLAALAL